MFSSEAYDRIDPYMERVVYEYWYSYTVLAQCLSAHLTVSRMTDDEARALGDTLYHRYKDCKTRTSLVKDEVDGINKELLEKTGISWVLHCQPAHREYEITSEKISNPKRFSK